MSESSTGEGVFARSLVKKLAAVMEAIDRIPKRGRNDFHKYDYAMEADIVAAIRHELAIRHVFLMPEVVAAERIEANKTNAGKVQWITRVTMTYTFMDGESGETLVQRWAGEGIDGEDKGLAKALTGAGKYFALKSFLIPTGDDPEMDDKPAVVKRGPQGLAPTTNASLINAAQVKRLKQLMRTHHTNVDEFKAWALARFKVEKAEAIRCADYDAITRYLIEGVDVGREVGAEG